MSYTEKLLRDSISALEKVNRSQRVYFVADAIRSFTKKESFRKASDLLVCAFVLSGYTDANPDLKIIKISDTVKINLSGRNICYSVDGYLNSTKISTGVSVKGTCDFDVVNAVIDDLRGRLKIEIESTFDVYVTVFRSASQDFADPTFSFNCAARNAAHLIDIVESLSSRFYIEEVKKEYPLSQIAMTSKRTEGRGVVHISVQVVSGGDAIRKLEPLLRQRLSFYGRKRNGNIK